MLQSRVYNTADCWVEYLRHCRSSCCKDLLVTLSAGSVLVCMFRNMQSLSQWLVVNSGICQELSDMAFAV